MVLKRYSLFCVYVLAVVSPIIKNFLHICVIPSMYDIPEIIKIAGNIPAVDELEFYDQ